MFDIKHADLVTAAVTGETPTQAFGICGGREDMQDREFRAAWDGCLDAPEAILLGGCVAVDTSRMPHGLGYEGTTPITKLREA